ncbi:PIN domain-containing protein [Spiribacter sp. 221]|uniref:PIN domain-containing protein n=1 Tax=Spiribacter onubensis TaxID=3122420 RepID=UPI00349FB9D2
MTEKYFVDTNVLIYKFDAGYPAHASIAHQWLKRLWRERTGIISTQVLKEFYGVMSRRITSEQPREQIRAVVRNLLTWPVVETDGGVLETAWTIEDKGHCSWWDAMIIAAAQHAGCSAILTEDLGEHLMPPGMRLINPFAGAIHEPSAHYEVRPDRLPG